MNIFKEVTIEVSDELEEFVRQMMKKGSTYYYEIQDVIEHLDPNCELMQEAERLRAVHGDFYFRA